MAVNKGASDRPDWLPDGMDPETSFKLEIRIVAPNYRGWWCLSDKVVDADVTNFRDLVDGVVDKSCGCGDIVRLFYFCMDSKVNIQVCSDQDLVEMFAKKRGPPKKRQKKAASCTSIVPVVNATTSQMVFPHNEAVLHATHKKRKKKSSSNSAAKNSKGSATTTTTSSCTPVTTSKRSETSSNDPVPIQDLQQTPFHEDSATTATGPVHTYPLNIVLPQASPRRKKMAVKKKYTPKKLQIQPASTTSPASPASNTRSKKQLNM